MADYTGWWVAEDVDSTADGALGNTTVSNGVIENIVFFNFELEIGLEIIINYSSSWSGNSDDESDCWISLLDGDTEVVLEG